MRAIFLRAMALSTVGARSYRGARCDATARPEALARAAAVADALYNRADALLDHPRILRDGAAHPGAARASRSPRARALGFAVLGGCGGGRAARRPRARRSRGPARRPRRAVGTEPRGVAARLS